MKYKDFQVLIIGSSLTRDQEVLESLQRAGCKVVCGYQEKIERFYQIADYFVFPVEKYEDGIYPKKYNQVGVIDMPLTVLEAMSCNLPVISTFFSSIARAVDVGNGFQWFDGSIDSLLTEIESMRTCQVLTREKVSKLDWQFVFENIHFIYKKILETA
jgi:glycosyltransferase involved in cell wall biosynthesis